jgi:outer membrane lipoprotein SlyB
VKPLCYDCGVIESVREIEKKGAGTGLGAVAGGVAGGVLGRQTGGGRGRDVMTVLGAIGGAVAGNAIEKRVNKTKAYEITIRFDDGTSQLVKQETQPAWHSGDRVKLVNGVITSNG